MGTLIPIAMELAQYVPNIIKLLTGSDKAGDVAEAVVNVAQAATGTTTGADALEKLKADPTAVMNFQAAMADKRIDLEKAYLTAEVADRADARSHDSDVRKLNEGHNRRADYMVLMDVIGLIACLVVLCLYRSSIPAEAVGLISTIAAAFSLCLRDAHQFEFGSSRSNRTKDETINNLSR